MKTATKVVTGISIVWVMGLIALVGFRWSELTSMDLNELGDFIAGTMSPLALFWLVAGYRQQGEELNLNTQALRDQQQELAKQVEATNTLAGHFEVSALANSTLAAISKEQDERERKRVEESSHPDLVFAFNTDAGVPHCFIHNKGGPAIKIKVMNSKNKLVSISDNILTLGQSAIFPLDDINLEDDYFYVTSNTVSGVATFAYTVTVHNGAVTNWDMHTHHNWDEFINSQRFSQ